MYQRLGQLAHDFEVKGPAYSWLTASAGLSSKEADTIAGRLQQAFALLHADCQGGVLKLDLDPARLLPGAGAAAGNAGGSCLIEGS